MGEEIIKVTENDGTMEVLLTGGAMEVLTALTLIINSIGEVTNMGFEDVIKLALSICEDPKCYDKLEN